MNKIAFLDRDGVINRDPGDYTYSLEEFEILPEVIPALKRLADLGYLIVIVTNQGGVAKGLYALSEVERIHEHLREQCEKSGVRIADFFVSPHHESTGRSLSRKPGSLLVERGLARHKGDPKKSVMIGDKERDMTAASGAGVRGIRIPVNGSLMEAVYRIESAEWD